MDIRALVPPDAPESVKQLVEGITKLTVQAPSMEELAKIVAAGPGEHQDRLFTQAMDRQMQKALKALVDRIDAVHAATCKNCGSGQVH